MKFVQEIKAFIGESMRKIITRNLFRLSYKANSNFQQRFIELNLYNILISFVQVNFSLSQEENK